MKVAMYNIYLNVDFNWLVEEIMLITYVIMLITQYSSIAKNGGWKD